MASATVLLTSTVLLLIGAAAGTALLGPDSWLDAGVAYCVLAAAAVVALLGITGALGQLRPGVVVAADVAWAAAMVAIVVRRRPQIRLPAPRWRALPHTFRRNRWSTAVAGLATAALAWQALVAVTLPPYAFDALTYHLTITTSWLRQGDLDPTPLSLCCAYYPANAELLFAWPMLLQGSDALVNLVQLGFTVLGALSVAGLARLAGLGDDAATAAAGLFAVTPIVLTQSPTGYADVIVAGCALAALYGLLRFAVTAERRHLVPAALATGLLLGTKGTGIIWAFVLGAGAIALLVTLVRRRRIAARTAAGAAAGFVAACLALGSFWYVRNWIDTGNPVYPFQVAPAGITIFEGPSSVDDILSVPDPRFEDSAPVEVVRSWASDLDFWRQGSYDYQQRLGGLGPLWAWLGLPLLVPFVVVLVRRRNPLSLAVAAVAIVFALQPYRWWSRFTIPLAALGAIAIAAAVVLAPRAWLRTSIRFVALFLAVAGVALSSREVDAAGGAAPLAATDVLRLVGKSEHERSLGRLFFPEYRFLDGVPEDATVVVDLEAPSVRFVYPLFGSRRSRQVLPSGRGPAPAGAWFVTGRGRPLDRRLQNAASFTLASDVRGVRVWRPER